MDIVEGNFPRETKKVERKIYDRRKQVRVEGSTEH
jgi:hypothetical protein